MSKSVGRVVAALAYLAACSAQLATTPQNVAAYAGDAIELACASSDSSPTMSWYEYISNAAGQVICINGASSGPPNPEIYTFGDPVEGVYNLGIELLSSSGGRYGCQQLAPITAYAYADVIVFEETPLCTFSFPPGDNAVEEGDEYSMTCSVSYLGDAGWAPKMEWKDDNGVISDVIDNSEEGKLDVTVTRSAALDHHGFEYSARIHFVAYDGTLPDDTATNIPSFNETHTFDAIVVHYSPRDIEFTEEKAEYVPGDEIVCSASGRPQPEYTWRNINSGLVIETDTLVITDEMLSEQQSYECEATNVIKGTTRNDTRSLTFSVITTPVPTSLPTTQSTWLSSTPYPRENNWKNTAIALGAVVGVLAFALISIIAVLLYFWIQRRGDCHQRDNPTRDTSQPSKERDHFENVSGPMEKDGSPDQKTSRPLENSTASYANMSHPMEQNVPSYENMTRPVETAPGVASPPLVSRAVTAGFSDLKRSYLLIRPDRHHRLR
ncbi:hypothetical protein CAPTEDRAFT_211913 [Capitella teleta]|uniref:Ig-like domain-containing protein n=1 Tax=Capitella teleta TaxID=283909 RepID=R7UDL9_CAPTE|nr:hypothetical protein CAPTEDRAFT_211913 [Capitella teleta]|eukprot:ELU04465.1 hypothetical protein CAPTEDRAFT_211913 [Capitella teleta]